MKKIQLYFMYVVLEALYELLLNAKVRGVIYEGIMDVKDMVRRERDK